MSLTFQNIYQPDHSKEAAQNTEAGTCQTILILVRS